METATIIAVVGAGGSLIAIATFWMRMGSTETKANQAIARAIKLENDLVELRVSVAREYASHTMIAAMENRIADAIKQLGDRLDGFVSNIINRGK